MNIITKLALASVLALSTAPAFAVSSFQNTAPEVHTLLERNNYLFTADAREIGRGGHQAQARTDRAVDAFAQTPADVNVDRHSIYRSF